MDAKIKKLRDYKEMWLLFCFGGWIYESIWVSMIEQNKGFVNRGFLFGPWIPIYGFGMFIIIPVIKKLKLKSIPSIFCLGAVLSATAELIGSYFVDIFIGKPLWNYSTYFGNFEGRIAVKPALTFGFLTVLGYFVAMPKLKEFQKNHDTLLRTIVSFMLSLLFIADFAARFFVGSNM